MVDIAELGLSVDSRGFVKAERDLDRFGKTASRVDRTAERLANNASRVGRALSVGLTLPLGAAAAASARLAIDAEETANKFNVVFRGSIDRANARIQELTRTIPQTATQLRDLASGVQDLIVPLGLARDEAADLSLTAVELAGDLASFNNVGADQVLEAIKSALAGSSEPMRRFGVDTRETRLQTLALNEGLVEQGEELDNAARAQAVFIALQRDSADAIGDAARTVDSAANQVRFLRREITQLSEDLGRELVPLVREVVGGLRGFVSGLNELDAETRRAVIGIGAVVAALGPLLIVLAAITNAIRTLLPLWRRLFGAAVVGVALKSSVDTFRALGLVIDDVKENFAGAADEADKFFGVIERGTFSLPDSPLASDLERISNLDLESAEAELARLQRTLRTIQRQSGSEEVIGPLEEEIAAVEARISELNSAASETPEALGKISGASEEAAERAAEVAESMKAMDDEIADAAAQLNGPMAEALREFQREAQRIGELFRNGDISGEQARIRLEQLEEQFRRTASAIGDDLIDDFQRMAFEVLPPFIQQMLRLENATDRVANSAQGLDAFGRIGSNFAQSIINGQSIADSIESALTGFAGQGISESFGELFSDALEGSFEDVFSSEAFRRNSAEGFALAIGQAVNGNIGQAAFTTAGNLIGGQVGSVIGSLLGGILFDGKVPKFQVRGTNATRATDAGTDDIISTLFGDIEFAFRRIDENAQNELIRIFDGFFDSLGAIVRGVGQRQEIADIVARFGISSRSGPDTPEQQLNLLLDDILNGAFDAFERAFVNVGNTLEERIQRLSELFQIENQTARGNDLGLGFQGLLSTLDDLRIGNESLTATFDRLQSVTSSLDEAFGLLGRQFDGGREALIRFGADLVALFGDDAGALAGQLDRAIGAIFSGEEIAQQAINQSRQRIADLLGQIGVNVSEDAFTAEGFRDIFDSLFGNLNAADTAALIEAGASLADLIDAERELADIRGEGIDALTRDWQRAIDGIRNALNSQLLGVSSLTPQQRFREAREQLFDAAAAAPTDINAASSLPGLFNQAINEAASFFGTAAPGFISAEREFRSLLEGLELGPDALPVAERQLGELQTISSLAERQVQLLESIDSRQPDFGFAVERDDRVVQRLDAIEQRIESGNQDRRRATEIQVAELTAIVEQLRREVRERRLSPPSAQQTAKISRQEVLRT